MRIRCSIEGGDGWAKFKAGFKPGWAKFRTGFMEQVRFLYPSGVTDWWNMVGRIMGACIVVGCWNLVSRGVIWLVT